MTAIACLKILISAAPPGLSPEALAPLVAKVGDAYLQSVWAWPRRYGLVAPFSFALADPQANRLDPSELSRMAAELQAKLFGLDSDGEVAMLLFEGDETEVMRLAAASLEAVEHILRGVQAADFTGRIVRIGADGVRELDPAAAAAAVASAGRAVERARAPRFAAPLFVSRDPAEPGWWGLYYLLKERFIGSIVNWPALSEAPPRDAEETLAQDLLHLVAAKAHDRLAAEGYAFLPVSFATLVKPSLRDAYYEEVRTIPDSVRHGLAANVYDVPREPSYAAMRQVQTVLKPHFAMVNFRVEDPAFEVAYIPNGVVDSVTLLLVGKTEPERLAAISRFQKQAPAYRARKAWQGVTGLRSTRELDLCRRLKIPFLSGPSVAPLTREAQWQAIWAADELPYAPWPG